MIKVKKWIGNYQDHFSNEQETAGGNEESELENVEGLKFNVFQVAKVFFRVKNLKLQTLNLKL